MRARGKLVLRLAGTLGFLSALLTFAGITNAQVYIGGYYYGVRTYTVSGAEFENSGFFGSGNPILSMALDGQGHIYTSSAGHGSYPYFDILKFTMDGTSIPGFHIQTTDALTALAADGHGQLFIGNSTTGAIMLYDSSGNLLNPALVTGLHNPSKIVLDGSGNLYVANHGNGTIGKYTTNGVALNPALISGLSGGVTITLALDGTGHVLTASWQAFGQGVVGEYTTSGDTVNASLISIGDPADIEVSQNGDLMVLIYGGNVEEFTPTGALVNDSFVSGLLFPFTMSVAPQLRIEAYDGNFGVRSNGFGFDITGPAGQNFVVETCTNLAAPDWSPMQTNNLGAGSVYFSDPQWTNQPVCFYRLRQQ